MPKDSEALEQAVLTRLMRLNATVYGIVTGLVIGAAIFLITNFLILKGGPIGPEGEPVIGPHLWLLGNFFIGYGVTFLGSLVGFAYGFGGGFILGYCVATVYNWLVEFKEARKARTRSNAKKITL
jgi:hypothetical protein